MPFIRNLWYVAAWSNELGEVPIGRTILGKPIVLFRTSDGTAAAMEDRCPHRHAPLSLGRVEGDFLRCMYHGMRFAADGSCNEAPGTTTIPAGCRTRSFPIAEKSSWIWVWMGDAALADPERIPTGFGLDNPEWALREGVLDYAANYELINDNLCDLSHLDFVHEKTLGHATGAKWMPVQPRVTSVEDGLTVERWFCDHLLSPMAPDRVDSWNIYEYLLPGVFLMTTHAFPVGTAAACNFERSAAMPVYRRVEQQAVTPIGERQTRYFYASGVDARIASPEFLDGLMVVINAAFAEDRAMIEAQQRIWDQTPADLQKVFMPHDKAPALFRRLVARRLAAEQLEPRSTREHDDVES